jgi:DMSO/TMAO reductase YedYZ molybdopterin-dependent catalytic subunit
MIAGTVCRPSHGGTNQSLEDAEMSADLSRRETLKRGLVAASLLALPEWILPALAQGETDAPFTDVPATFNPRPPNGNNRFLDLRTLDGRITPADQFFFIQHYNRPEIDGSAFRLKLTGLFKKPVELSLADIKAMKSVEMECGYECSGNSPRAMQGLSSNGRFTGVRLRDVLKRVGVDDRAREVVFFGADRGPEEVVFRQNTFKVQQQFGRSITMENAMKPEPILAYSLNGQPLDREHGFPLRVVMPGWYGVANVKWLAEVHLQENRYLGNYQARWYRTLRAVGGTGEDADAQTQFVETEVTRLNVKSVIGRVRKTASGDHRVIGFVLNDGTPLKSVEVKVDDGPWQAAQLDSANTEYSWKLFTYQWKGASAGEHTIVSRATDINGVVQPTVAELARKRTFLEDNSQFPRRVRIA